MAGPAATSPTQSSPRSRSSSGTGPATPAAARRRRQRPRCPRAPPRSEPHDRLAHHPRPARPPQPAAARDERLRAAVAAIEAAPADWTYALANPEGPQSGAEFCVNFLGGMASDAPIGALLKPVPLDLGPPRGAANPRAHLIDLEAETAADGLRLLWRYPATMFDAATIRALAERHLTLLTELAGAA